jgi:glycosyltransferase involved in cell wall biosynthesis
MKLPKILIITEAYEKQINGVVTTLRNTAYELEKMGCQVVMITPGNEVFKAIPCPTYPEIDLVINPWKVINIIREEKPDYIHIATEGPLSLLAAMYCRWKNIQFTSSYHTKLPEYIHARFKFIHPNLIYAYLRFLHWKSKAVLVTTNSMKEELEAKKFKNIFVWGRGVDSTIFNGGLRVGNNIAPKLLYVGRVSTEKNIPAFLDLKLDFPHEKIVVGDGPLLEKFKVEYPNVTFMGALKGNKLAYIYANADVFVFPSLTDTFGIVQIEASACGTPVAGFPVTGLKDYVKPGVTGYLDTDLTVAIKKCLKIKRFACAEEASKYTWRSVTEVFYNKLHHV